MRSRRQHGGLIGTEKIGPPSFEIHEEGFILIVMALFVAAIVVFKVFL